MIFDIKEVAICLNASNLWVETWREGSESKVDLYRRELKGIFVLTLTTMFGKNIPPLREDLEMLVKNAQTLEDFQFLCHRFMEVMIYFIAVSQDRYISVHEEQFKLWRKEQEEIEKHDPSDFIFL